ncbi:MAG: cysteine-rich CWC family protein [Candidatus Kapaibacteriota bacterium]|jgi:hypothetical protein
MLNGESSKYAPSECGNCGREFVCKAGTPALCDCFHIRLTPAELRAIEEIYERECVCATCLRELQQTIQQQLSRL